MRQRTAIDRLTRWGWRDPPWQLEAESLAHIPAQHLDGRAVLLGKRRGDHFWLYALAVDPERRRRGWRPAPSRCFRPHGSAFRR